MANQPSRRSVKSTTAQNRNTVPVDTDVSQGVRQALLNIIPFEGNPAAPYSRLTNAGQPRRTRTTSSMDVAVVRIPTFVPPAPAWVAFIGQAGVGFQGTLTRPSLPAAGPAIDMMMYQVQLASDAAFTANVQAYDIGPTRSFVVPLAGVTRFARARVKFFSGDFSAWAPFPNGSAPPTSRTT